MEAAIATLVQRLETVTARLESVEKQLQSGGSTATAGPQAAASSGATAAFVSQYEDLINQFIVPYVEVSKKLDPVVGQQADLVLKAVYAQRDFLKVAAACKKPADSVLPTLIKSTSDLMGEISALKDKNRTSKFFNNLSTVAEGIAALGWVVVSPTPGPHIADMRGGSEFYSNRILKDFKGKDQNQVDFVTHFNGFLKELQNYVKQNHTTGTTWNPRGEDAANYKVTGSSSADSGSAPPPPPGPPPPPVMDAAPVSPTSSSGPDMTAVFSALNKGEDVTKGLKKVTKDMKTKNRTDKSSVVPAVVKSETASAPKQTTKVTKPPKFALEGNKWTVEYQVGNKNIIIDQTEVKQTVYIYRCQNSVIQIKGKVNAVTVDECSKTGIVFENVVASFDVVNCNSVEVQVLGKVPNIAIDKTSGCQVFLSKDSLDTEIVTSKSSEMNVSFPVEGADDIVEFPVPEQYKSHVKDGKLVTELSSHV